MNKLVGRDNPYRYTVSNNLYLLIKPSSRKYWRFDYSFQEKRNTISIGVFPKIGLFEAVIKANDIIGQLRQGFDPKPKRKKPQLPTFREMTLQYAETRGVSWNSTNGRNMNLFKTYIFPELGDKPIDEITSTQLDEIINKLSETGKAKATRALNSCVGIYAFAIEKEICKINVALETKKLRNQTN
ncbi:MAG: Arm DNA-binding domain-containing protein [Methylococcaceae bacterium]